MLYYTYIRKKGFYRSFIVFYNYQLIKIFYKMYALKFYYTKTLFNLNQTGYYFKILKIPLTFTLPHSHQNKFKLIHFYPKYQDYQSSNNTA
jgi:hypothetical protein